MIKLFNLNKKRASISASFFCAALVFSACKAEPETGDCISDKNKWIKCPENVYEVNNRKACLDRYEKDKIEVQRYGYVPTTRWTIPNNMSLFDSNPAFRLYPANAQDKYYLEISGAIGSSETKVHNDSIGTWSFTSYTYSAPVKVYRIIGMCPITCSANLDYIGRYDIPMQSLGPIALVSARYSSLSKSSGWTY